LTSSDAVDKIMSEEVTIERRQHPRVPAGFPLKLDSLSEATVRDISRSGVCCVTSNPLSPMTLVGLLLELPTGRPGGDDHVPCPCRGVVVRCRALDDVKGPSYETAILFQDLEPDAVDMIGSYVDGQLSSPAG